MQPDCPKVLHKGQLVSVLMYESEPLVWGKKETSRNRNEQKENLRSLLGTRRIDRIDR